MCLPQAAQAATARGAEGAGGWHIPCLALAGTEMCLNLHTQLRDARAKALLECSKAYSPYGWKAAVLWL